MFHWTYNGNFKSIWQMFNFDKATKKRKKKQRRKKYTTEKNSLAGRIKKNEKWTKDKMWLLVSLITRKYVILCVSTVCQYKYVLIRKINSSSSSISFLCLAAIRSVFNVCFAKQTNKKKTFVYVLYTFEHFVLHILVIMPLPFHLSIHKIIFSLILWLAFVYKSSLSV